MYYIELQEVSRTFSSGRETACVLSHVSFSICRGEFVAITGPSSGRGNKNSLRAAARIYQL